MLSKNKEWRVPAFNVRDENKSLKKPHRKKVRRKLQPLAANNDDNSLFQAKNENDTMFQMSPVLNKRFKPNEETSPIINKNKQKLIRLRKINLIKNKLKCSRQLVEITNMNCTVNFSKSPPNNKSVVSVNNYEHLNENVNFHVKEINTSQKDYENELFKSFTMQNVEYCEKPDIFEDNLSLDFIESQLSVKIETSQSPTKLTQRSEKLSIDTCTSQDSSAITISTNSTADDSQEPKPITDIVLVPRQKKKYKPGTLAYHVQKLLQKQKCDVAIWKHELYLTATTNFEAPVTKQHTVISLKVQQIWNSFGVFILQCTYIDIVQLEKCFVIIDVNYNHDILEVNSVIDIYPVCFVKYLQICNSKVKTYINVHKIVKIH